MSKKTTTINIRVTPDDKARYKAAAGGRDLSVIARAALDRMANRYEREKASEAAE